MKIFQNKDKEVFIKKTGQNKYLINIPYDKITKTGQKRKVFWGCVKLSNTISNLTLGNTSFGFDSLMFFPY